MTQATNQSKSGEKYICASCAKKRVDKCSYCGIEKSTVTFATKRKPFLECYYCENGLPCLFMGSGDPTHL